MRLLMFLCTAFFMSAHAAPTTFIQGVRYLPRTGYEAQANLQRQAVFTDRHVYWNDDLTGQILVMALGADIAGKTARLTVTTPEGELVREAEIGPFESEKAALVLGMAQLIPGDYLLRVHLPAGSVETAFRRANREMPVEPFPPAGIPLEVQPQRAQPAGSWPITLGIPMPQGTLFSTAGLELLEDEQPIPAQFQVLQTWHPPSAEFSPSIRWLHLTFSARYRDGEPLSYRLIKRQTSRPPPITDLSITRTEDAFTVQTAGARFQIRRQGFDGIHAAWHDHNANDTFEPTEQVILPRDDQPRGPYLVDSRGIRFEAALDPAAEVSVEVEGPLKVVIVAKGWYTNPKLSSLAGQQLCQFVTRLTFHAGRPEVQVDNRTILTFDTDRHRLLDIGFGVPIQEAASLSAGVDEAVLTSALPAADPPLILHQYRWDAVRLTNLSQPGSTAGQPSAETHEGTRSDGWVSLTFGQPDPLALEDERPTLSLFARHVWQKFPKEISANRQRLTIHAWPAHGRATFSQEEMFAPASIYKLRWYHHGRLLDLRFPAPAYDALSSLDWQDPEDMIGAAVSGNGQGVAIASEFCLRLSHADDQTTRRAALYQQNPLARSDPAWNVASGVQGPVAARQEDFAAMEEEIDTAYPAYQRIVVHGDEEYGMFVYGNTHNNYHPEERRAQLHRVWQASHYRQVWEPWFLFFRGNSFDLVSWARIYGDHFADVSTTNYADEANARIKWHIQGGMYHAKGFTPWGSKAFGQESGISYAGSWGHWINPTAFLIRYLLEGHGRSRDLGSVWVQATKDHKYYTGASREMGNTSNEIIHYYRHTWDPDLIPILRDMTDGMLDRRFKDWPAPYHHPWFNPFWFVHWYDFARDPRVPERVREYIHEDGYDGSATMHALLAREDGSTDLLARYMADYATLALNRYQNPGDPLDGYRDRFISDPYTKRQQWPFWLKAARDAGFGQLDPGATTSMYPTGSAHPWFIDGQLPSVEMLALEPQDQAIRLVLETAGGSDEHPMSMRLFGPNDQLLVDKSLQTVAEGRLRRYRGDTAIVLEHPADGNVGLYRLDIRGHEVKFASPYSNLPAEGCRLLPERDYRSTVGLDHYLMPLGEAGAVSLTYSAFSYRNRSSASIVRLTDAQGGIIAASSVMPGSQRPTVTFTIDPAVHPAPWHLYTIGIGSLRWTGLPTALLAANTAEGASQLADAVP